MTELKPCPFCGGEAHLRQYYDYEDKSSYCYVYCNKCGARTSVYSRKHNAIRVWNKRPNPWHTGTPTEEGWYLLHTKETMPYRVAYMRDNHWLSTSDSYIRTDIVIGWQKIELYKEKQDGRTD